MLNRFKVIKDLILGKLDDSLARLERVESVQASVQASVQTLVDSNRRLEKMAEAQLKNEAALLQAAIHASQGSQAPGTGSAAPCLLLGNAEEVAIAQTLLQAACPLLTQTWNWGETPDLSQLSDAGQVVVCKMPTEPPHWEALHKLQQQVPGRLVLLTSLP